MKLYSLKDNKVGKFGYPFPIVNDQVAIRSFKVLVNDSSTEMGKYPEDFELYRIGDLNEDTGVISSDVEFLILGSNLVEVKENGDV